MSTGGCPQVVAKKVELLKDFYNIIVVEWECVAWAYVVQRNRVINMIGDKGKPIKELIYAFSQVFFRSIEIIIKLAPLGVFGYMSYSIADQGLEVLQSLGKLAITVLLACLVQYIIFGILIAVFGKMSPMPFYKKI